MRISCAALCRIEIGVKFLLEINKNRGDILTPIGGAFKFHPAAREFLTGLGAVYQRGDDLRLELPQGSVPQFEDWFKTRKDRETDPLRELQEELVDEHRLPISSASFGDAKVKYLGLATQQAESTRKGFGGNMLTHYFFECHQVTLPEDVADVAIKAANDANSRLRLVSRDEIMAGKSDSGLPIAESAKVLFNCSRQDEI